jgi:hypothetical protein
MTQRTQGSTTYVRLIAAIVLSAVSAWAAAMYFNRHAPRPNASPRPRPEHYGLPPLSSPAPAAKQEPVEQTTISALPAFASGSGPAMMWDGIQGLQIRSADTPPVVSGQQPLVLALATSDGLHRIGMRFAGLAAGARYRATAWLKRASADHIALDVRDGTATNGGIALFDLTTSTILKSSGNLAGMSVALDVDGWVKASMDLWSSDGVVVVYVGQLGPDQSMRFQGRAGSELTFGGIEVTRAP